MTRILVVDDDILGLNLIIDFLEANGHVCAGASNAKEARHLLNRMQFNLIITDQHMPGECGLQLLSYVLSEFSHIAGIIITGGSDTQIQRRALEIGVYACMTKPVCHQELLDNISNIDNKKNEQYKSI